MFNCTFLKTVFLFQEKECIPSSPTWLGKRAGKVIPVAIAYKGGSHLNISKGGDAMEGDLGSFLKRGSH